MGKIFYIFVLMLCSINSFAQETFESSVTFVAKSWGIECQGQLDGMAGKVTWDAQHLENSSLWASVSSASVDTGIGLRNIHLRGAEWFAAGKNPLLKFVSSKITRVKDQYWTEGTLMIKGIKNNIKVPFTVFKKDGKLYLKGEFELKRKDYRMGRGYVFVSQKVLVKVKAVVNASTGKIIPAPEKKVQPRLKSRRTQRKY